MAELLTRIKGKAILTINDHPDIREIFAGLNCYQTDINYTVGGGGKAKAAKELIYCINSQNHLDLYEQCSCNR
ncbi:MAG: hypothetical protein Tsb002_01110 [Wenzhouxiangellaceae bacterium]